MFGLLACGEKEEPLAVVGIEVFVLDSKTPNYYSCEWDNILDNNEAFTMDDVSVYYVYSDGKRMLIENNEFSYKSLVIDPKSNYYVESEVNHDFLTNGETEQNIPGTYKIRFFSNIQNFTADLTVDILKGKRVVDFDIYHYDEVGSSTSSVATLESGKDYYEINFAQEYYFDRPHYFFKAQAEGMLPEDFTFIITYDNGEYLLNDQFFRYATIGEVKGTKFLNENGTYLKPGKYLVFAKYGESEYYKEGVSEPIKINVISKDISVYSKGIATFDHYKLFERDYATPVKDYEKVAIRFNDVNIFRENTLMNLANVFHIDTVLESNKGYYVTINSFDGAKWTKNSLSSMSGETLKVHAYKNEDKYYVVDYVDDKWYIFGTSTEVPSNKVRFVDYTMIEEFSTALSIKAVILVSVNQNGVNVSERATLAGYSNLNDLFRVEIDVEKYSIYLDTNVKPIQSLIYDATISPNGLALEQQDELKRFVYEKLKYNINLFNVDYTGIDGLEMPTTFGDYQMSVELLNNPNVCFAEMNGNTMEVKVDRYLGQSLSWSYEVFATMPYPITINKNVKLIDDSVAVEFNYDAKSDVYLYSTYFDMIDTTYFDLYFYELQEEDVIVDLTDDDFLAKIKKEGNKYYSNDLNTLRFVSAQIPKVEAKDKILGRSFCLYAEPKEHVVLDDVEGGALIKKIDIKKSHAVQVKKEVLLPFSLSNSFVDIDLSYYVTSEDENADEVLKEAQYIIMEEGTTIYEAASMEGSILTCTSLHDGLTICVRVKILGDSQYFTYQDEISVKLTSNVYEA
ncbi:MAG: hypothetical protein IJ033_00545 [Clostridia bacterium]|nr:hypothetical protein [Clostridia bacterium]